MKRKIQLKKGLSINKESVAKLQESQMAQLKGGAQLNSCGEYSCSQTANPPQSCNRASCNDTKVEEVII
jgi:hypothetical protein